MWYLLSVSLRKVTVDVDPLVEELSLSFLFSSFFFCFLSSSPSPLFLLSLSLSLALSLSSQHFQKHFQQRKMRASRLVLVRRQEWAILWPILAGSVNTSLCTTQNCHSTKAMTWKLTRKIQTWISKSVSIIISISSSRREKGKETKIAWLHHQLELALYLRLQSTFRRVEREGGGLWVNKTLLVLQQWKRRSTYQCLSKTLDSGKSLRKFLRWGRGQGEQRINNWKYSN